MAVKPAKKASIGRWWMGFVLASNFVLVGYLYYYQQPTGLIAGLPEPYVVLIAFMTLVVSTNSLLAWLYLGKPDLREVFTQPKSADSTEGQ